MYIHVCVFLRNGLHAHTFKNYYQVQVSDERVDAKPTDILVINVTIVKYKLKYILAYI